MGVSRYGRRIRVLRKVNSYRDHSVYGRLSEHFPPLSVGYREPNNVFIRQHAEANIRWILADQRAAAICSKYLNVD